VKTPVVAGNNTQDTWLVQTVHSHWATTTRPHSKVGGTALATQTRCPGFNSWWLL